MQQSLLFLTYEYDGNGKVNSSAGFIGNVNPFRWKSLYYDTESGLYYANGSYYDPSTGLYVDAAPIESVIENPLGVNGLDRNGLVCNNILELASNPSTVFNVTELHSDPTYDVTDKFPDWMKRQIKRQEKINKILRWYQELHWGWKLGVGIALLIGAICFTVATGGGGAGVISVLVQTAIGVGVGVGLYTVGSLMSESFTVEGLANAALNAFLITSATVFISSAVNYIKYLSRGKQLNTVGLKECTNQCFIAGTLVHCEDGTKKIEDIEVGDRVLAYDEETGEQGYKEVVKLFHNETLTTVRLKIIPKSVEHCASIDEIVCTPNHPFYVLNVGSDRQVILFDNEKKKKVNGAWMAAGDIQIGDECLLANGQTALICEYRIQELDNPVKTYNLEVAESHTYHVGINGICVHNDCGGKAFTKNQQSVIDLAREAKKAGGITRQNAETLVGWAREYGISAHMPMTHPLRSGMWSYTEHINIFNMHIPILS